MTSKSWLKRSALACAVISLGATLARTQPAPAIALLDPNDAPQWQKAASQPGWRVLTAAAESGANVDQRIAGLATAIREAVKKSEVDPARVYLAGRGADTAAVFYGVSRLPDLFAAAVAVGGSPQAAIDSDRLFAVNFTLAPVLWVGVTPDDAALAKKLEAAGVAMEYRSGQSISNAAVFEWLGKHARPSFPPEVDCETSSPAFSSCYWIQMSKFDAGERNDVLPSTRIPAAAKASLDLGPFQYSIEDPGPGILVGPLPPKYSGPLKAGDRIVALNGKPIENAKKFAEMMEGVTKSQPAVAMVERGKEHVRLETQLVVSERQAPVTARVQGKYVAEDHTIQIISRTVKEMRVTVPPEWAEKASLYWNGLALENIERPGCFLLTIDKELLHAAPCQ